MIQCSNTIKLRNPKKNIDLEKFEFEITKISFDDTFSFQIPKIKNSAAFNFNKQEMKTFMACEFGISKGSQLRNIENKNM